MGKLLPAGRNPSQQIGPSCFASTNTMGEPPMRRLPIFGPCLFPASRFFYDLAYGHALDTANSMDALENFLYQHTAAPVSNAVENEEKDAGSGGGLSGGLLGWLTGK
mmetsp:Transcript_25021/g.51863  ORF Transcript_25021/g.51863 Transcript_25021/m.51863 type:complete len:107 (+) Transcript_25021:1403-1723(+)